MEAYGKIFNFISKKQNRNSKQLPRRKSNPKACAILSKLFGLNKTENFNLPFFLRFVRKRHLKPFEYKPNNCQPSTKAFERSKPCILQTPRKNNYLLPKTKKHERLYGFCRKFDKLK